MEPCQEFTTVHLRQTKIKEHEVKRSGTLHLPQRVDAIDGGRHPATDTLESPSQEKDEVGFVLDYENGERSLGC